MSKRIRHRITLSHSLLSFILVTSFTLALFVVEEGCTQRSIETNSLEAFTIHLGEQTTQLMDRYGIPGVTLALIKDRELAWSSAYGYAITGENKKMSVDAIFRAESISKSVTAWGVMKLVERGLINLDDPVQQYLSNFSLPQSEYNLNEVTIRRLLSNSAGLPLGSLGEEYSTNGQKPSLRQYLSKEVQFTYEPGSSFEYSNPGFNLLELLIEEVTGRDFNDYMVSELLIPLGMHNSSFDWDEDWSSRVPMGYDLQGNSVPPYVYPYRASGGLFSTVEDIARFAIAEMSPPNTRQLKVLSEEGIQTMRIPQIKTSGIFGFVAEGYGFGHFIETLSDGKKAVWHGGQGHGWMTHFHFVPETGDGIVIFTNSQRSWPLIAHILDDWSIWSGNGAVKFSRIVSASIVIWVITGFIFLFSLWCTGKGIVDIKAGKRKFNFSPLIITKQRILDFLLGLVPIIILVWAVAQDYLFISSVFPVGAIWLAWALLCFSLVFLISALVPIITRSHTHQKGN